MDRNKKKDDKIKQEVNTQDTVPNIDSRHSMVYISNKELDSVNMFSDELKKVNKDVDKKEHQKELNRRRRLEIAPEKIIESIKDEARQKVRQKEFKSYNEKKSSYY